MTSLAHTLGTKAPRRKDRQPCTHARTPVCRKKRQRASTLAAAVMCHHPCSYAHVCVCVCVCCRRATLIDRIKAAEGWLQFEVVTPLLVDPPKPAATRSHTVPVLSMICLAMAVAMGALIQSHGVTVDDVRKFVTEDLQDLSMDDVYTISVDDVYKLGRLLAPPASTPSAHTAPLRDHTPVAAAGARDFRIMSTMECDAGLIKVNTEVECVQAATTLGFPFERVIGATSFYWGAQEAWKCVYETEDRKVGQSHSVHKVKMAQHLDSIRPRL